MTSSPTMLMFTTHWTLSDNLIRRIWRLKRRNKHSEHQESMILPSTILIPFILISLQQLSGCSHSISRPSPLPPLLLPSDLHQTQLSHPNNPKTSPEPIASTIAGLMVQATTPVIDANFQLKAIKWTQLSITARMVQTQAVQNTTIEGVELM